MTRTRRLGLLVLSGLLAVLVLGAAGCGRDAADFRLEIRLAADADRDQDIVALAREQEGATVARDGEVVAKWVDVDEDLVDVARLRNAPGVLLREDPGTQILVLVQDGDVVDSVARRFLTPLQDGSAGWSIEFTKEGTDRLEDWSDFNEGSRAAVIVNGQARTVALIWTRLTRIVVPATAAETPADWLGKPPPRPAGRAHVPPLLWAVIGAAAVVGLLALMILLAARHPRSKNAE